MQNFRNPQIEQNQCLISQYLERVGVSNLVNIKNSINYHYTQIFLKKLQMSDRTVCETRLKRAVRIAHQIDLYVMRCLRYTKVRDFVK